MTYCQYALCRVIPKVHSYLWHFIPKAIFCTELSIPSQPRSQKVRNRKPLDNKKIQSGRKREKIRYKMFGSPISVTLSYNNCWTIFWSDGCFCQNIFQLMLQSSCRCHEEWGTSWPSPTSTYCAKDDEMHQAKHLNLQQTKHLNMQQPKIIWEKQSTESSEGGLPYDNIWNIGSPETPKTTCCRSPARETQYKISWREHSVLLWEVCCLKQIHLRVWG